MHYDPITNIATAFTCGLEVQAEFTPYEAGTRTDGPDGGELVDRTMQVNRVDDINELNEALEQESTDTMVRVIGLLRGHSDGYVPKRASALLVDLWGEKFLEALTSD